jgi:hypothetical protein
MDFADQLAAITKHCHLVVSPDQAVHIAPDLCVDAPPVWDLGEDRPEGAPRWAYPVACTSRLAQPVAEVVSRALDAALADKERESFAGASAADWASDPLSATLARLLAEAALISPQTTGLPLLEIARISRGLLSGTAPSSASRGAAAAAIERALPQLEEQPPMRKGEILGQIAWSLSARMSAAWGLAAQAVPGLRPTRFFQAMLRSKLCLVTSVDRELPNLSIVLGVLDIPGDAAILAKLLQVCESGIAAIETRQKEGKAKAADRRFSASVLSRTAVPIGSDQRARLLAYNPDVATAFLLELSKFYSVRELGKLGVDKQQAKQLHDPELAQALAASLGEALQALQLLDLLGGMISLVQHPEDIQVPRWQKSFVSRLVVPRGDLGDTKAFVVSARLGDVQNKAFQEARTNDDSLIPLALVSRTRALQDQLEGMGAAVYHTGSHLVALLGSATSAVAVAEKIAEVSTPPFSLDFGPLRQPTSVPRGPALGIGLAYGNVHGGFDGRAHAVRGPAVEQAQGLTGIDAPHGALGDPLGVRHVALGASGLVSKGLVASPEFIEQLTDEASRQGRRFQLPDAGQPVAGVRKPFVAYPVAGVREGNDRTVILLLKLDGEDKNSPVEIIRMGIDSFQEFHGHEQGLQPGSCRGLSAGGGGVYPPVAPPTPATRSEPQVEYSAVPVTASADSSDPFQSDPAALLPDGSAPGVFDFETEEDEEYEFEIEEEPFTPPPVMEDPIEDDSFAFDDIEMDDFDEGVLVLGEEPDLEAEQHPLDRIELEGPSTDSSPFAFDSDTALDADDSFTGAEDDLFSFEGLDDDEDPFASRADANPAAISMSGESSLDAWDTAPEGDLDPSQAGEQTDDEAPLGFLPPAEPREHSPRHSPEPPSPEPLPEPEPGAPPPPDDDAIPLGYLPPAPGDDPDANAELHEVSLSRPAARPRAHPTMVPPSTDSDHVPSMPASLLALLGEEEPDAEPPGDGGGAFRFLSDDAPEAPVEVPAPDIAPAPQPEPPPEPEANPDAEPELDIPSVDSIDEAPFSLDEPDDEEDPFAIDEPEEEEDPFSLDEPDDEEDPFAIDEPEEEEDPFAARELDEDDDPWGEREEQQPEPAPSPSPAASSATVQAEREALDIDDDDLPSDPLADGDDEDAFESLFSSDPEDEDLDIELSEIMDKADLADAQMAEPIIEEPEPPVEEEPEPPVEEEPEPPVEEEPEPPVEEEPEPPVEEEPEDLEDPFELDDELPSSEEPAPSPQGKGADGAPKVRSGSKSKTMPDFSFMFTGYHIFVTEKRTVLFGHRYGSLLLDAHEYPCGDDIPKAYELFLADKVTERFVPRADLSRPVPKKLEGRPLDVALMQQAFVNLNED